MLGLVGWIVELSPGYGRGKVTGLNRIPQTPVATGDSECRESRVQGVSVA